MYTEKELEEWKKIRRNKSAPVLENPRTGKSIKRNGSTYQSLEKAFESLQIKRKTKEREREMEREKDVEGTLIKVMEHLALTGDTRSATKLGVLSRSLQKEYKLRVPSKGRQNYALNVPISIIQEMVQEVLTKYEKEHIKADDTSFTVSKKVSTDVSYYLRQILLNRLEFVKRISYSPLLLKAESIHTVIHSFLTSYTDCSVELMYVNNIRNKVVEAYHEVANSSFTPSQKRLYEAIYHQQGVSKEIATFFTMFVFVYMMEYITGIFHKVRREETKGILRLSLSSIYQTCQLRHTLMKEGIDYLIHRNRVEHFENVLHDMFISPNIVLYYDKKEVPLITFLRERNKPEFVAIVERHPNFLEPKNIRYV